MAGLVRGSGGAEPHGRRRIFENLQKNFLRKLQNMHCFNIFFKKSNKPYVNISRVWTKNKNSCEILRNFRKFSKACVRKFQKIHYFTICFEKYNKPCPNFSLVWTKTPNCWEILRKFGKCLMKIQ